ncbi:MAG: hypothetical protein WCY77_03840 [Weeksellaceae bacterium]
MKKLHYLFLATLLFTLNACKNDDDKPQPSSVCMIEVPCEDPVGLVSVADAKVMEDHYKNEFYGILNEIKGGQYPGYDGPVRDIWFDLDELKQYIAYVENYAASNGYSDLGLRVYMGAKDELGQDGQVYPRQTIFFVPTTRISDTGQGGVGQDGFQDQNLLGIDRLNYGNAGIPDSRDSDTGIGGN